MSSPQRAKGRPLFDPNALDDELDDAWPTQVRTPAASPDQTAQQVGAVPPTKQPTQALHTTPEGTGSTASSASGEASPPTPVQHRSSVSSRPSEPTGPRRAARGATGGAEQKRFRPPEVLLAAEVYDAIYQLQIAEKKRRRALARSMGVIVLDAIEAHAAQLRTAWSAAADEVGEGGLFVRPSAAVVSHRRRHVKAPRSVVLSGVNAANGARLDELVDEWGAGTRSALVEQALRYEFKLL